MMAIHEKINVRKANKQEGKTVYLYNNKIYAYSNLKNLKYEDRWRVVMNNTENYKEKLKEDIADGLIIEVID